MIKTISITKVLEAEADDCERLALLRDSPRTEIFQILAFSYRSLAQKIKEETRPYANKNQAKKT